jgi:hypothetical protein
MRCLKRYIAREIYTTLKADLANLPQPAKPTTSHLPANTTAIPGPNPGLCITR